MDDSDLLRETKAFLTKDFEQAFEIVRTQKLLSRSRSLAVTRVLCEELESWAKTSFLNNKNKSRLIRHCKITIAFQTMMSSVRERADNLKIWALCFSDFAEILISSLEAINIAFNQRLIDQTVSSGGRDFLTSTRTKNWMFRASLDSAQLILNEGRKRCSVYSDFETGSPDAFTRSLELAHDTSEVMLAWDFYSFGQAQVSVRENEIKVNRPDTLSAIRRGNYRQRMMELDIAYRSSAQQRLNMLAEELKDTVSGAELPATFDEIVALPIWLNILEQLLPATKALEKDISDALEALIDLDEEVKLGKLRHVYRDLITIWAYLVRLAVMSRLWGELVHSATGEYPPITLTIKRLRETFIGLREMPEPSIDKAIRHFSSFIDQKHHIDLYYQPLLHLTEEEILIPASYILNSRFDRNLISIVARERNDSLAVKGKKPLRRLKSLFERAGFWCLEDIDIRDSRGHLATDLDLLVVKESDVFFFQSKVLSIPDSPYEHWRVDQTLLSAAIQMDVVRNHKSQIEQACQKASPRFTLEGKQISAYIITDVMVHSGFTMGGYQVIDFDHLEHILNGAHVGFIDIRSQEVIQAFRAIEGRFPSPDDIRRLISALRSPKPAPIKGITERRVEFGDWTLVLEAKAFV